MELNRTAAYRVNLRGLAMALLCILMCLSTRNLFAQNAGAQDSTPRVTLTLIDRPFPEALAVIETKIPYKFAYSSELARGQQRLTIRATAMPLTDFLQALFRGTGIRYQFIGDQIVLQTGPAGGRVTFSGYVRDGGTGESLVGASVYAPAKGVGAISNNYGFYSLTVPVTDSVEVVVSYVGYVTMTVQMATRDRDRSFSLAHSAAVEAIGALVLTKDRREDNVRKNQPALVDLPTDMITAAPSVDGSGDIIGSVEMLPGVQAGIDGTPGYFVRGGNAGQNLVLLDDATLYNPSHIFGLVGIFNPPTVKYASLLKGGFPAIYGDHISSVLNVVMKDGSNQQTGGNVQMGTLSSGATVYGPLEKGKSSYLISGRRSMTDVLLHPLLQNNYFKDYYFYDVNAKLSFQLSPKDRLLVGFYSGRDNNTYSGNSTDSTGIDYSMNFG